MKYKVAHRTIYEYSDSVPLCQNEAHLTPRNSAGQTCRYHRLIIRPAPAHRRRLMISAISKVEVHPRPLPNPTETPPWEEVRDQLAADTSAEGLEIFQFRFDSPMVAAADEYAEYAAPSFPPGRPILACLLDLTSRIHRDFTYDPTATTVLTPLNEVFALRRGVCQDLAHVEIACVRSLGLAARYVSGYLRTRPPEGMPPLVGADASHAWISVYCGSAGWIDADPTNDLLPSSEHIVVAWGRDYSDVSPINGLFIGGGQHAMSVGVTVMPLAR